MGSDWSMFKQQLRVVKLIRKAKNHNIEAMHELATYYKSIRNYDKFKKYLEIASNKGDLKAMKILGNYYRSMLKKYRTITIENKMEKYYVMAYDKGDTSSMLCLIDYYRKRIDTANVIKYHTLLMNNNIKYVNGLIMYLKNSDLEDKYDQIEKYYKIAYDKGIKKAIVDLAIYFKQNRINKKDELIKIATDHEDFDTLQKLESIYKDVYLNLKIKDRIEDCMICYEEKQMYHTRCLKHCICYDCMDQLYDKPCPMCRQ